MRRVRQMRPVTEQLLFFAESLARECDVPPFQRPQAAQHASCPAGRAASKIVLLDQQSPLSCPRAFSGDGHSHDAATDDGYLEMLAGKELSICSGQLHGLRGIEGQLAPSGHTPPDRVL